MKGGRWLGLCLALATVAPLACSSSPERRGKATPDRTRDPEFEAAREAARPEFESQAEALAAGVYEPFVHPDSVVAGDPEAPAGGGGAPPPGPGGTSHPGRRGTPGGDRPAKSMGPGGG